jgi:hypothetical protein
VAIRVVVLLEVIDVEIDAAPLTFRLRLTLPADRVQIAAIVTACQWISNTQLEELCLKLFPLGDIDQNSVTIFLTCRWIDRKERTVYDRAYFAIAPGELKLDIAHRAFALEQSHFPLSHFRADEIARAKPSEIFQRVHTEHFKERGIRVDDVTLEIRDVDALLEPQRQLAERGRIAQTAVALSLRFAGSPGAGQINASRGGMSVASVERNHWRYYASQAKAGTR